MPRIEMCPPRLKRFLLRRPRRLLALPTWPDGPLDPLYGKDSAYGKHWTYGGIVEQFVRLYERGYDNMPRPKRGAAKRRPFPGRHQGGAIKLGGVR